MMSRKLSPFQAIAPQLIGLEATGGYQRAVVAALVVAVLPIVGINPRQVRDIAKATGQLAKTDVLDARAVAHFAEAGRPTPRPQLDAQRFWLCAPLSRTAWRTRRVAFELTSKLISPGSNSV
jgi:transposase